MSVVFTVGHSTRSADEFLELLGANGVRALVDVRRYPGSRRYPHFNRESLSELLSTVGITYHHAPELGGRRESTSDSPNLFWKNASFRAYADYMSTPQFQTAFERLEQIAETQSTAIMCAEAVPWRCHRQLIADALVGRGHEVRHILSKQRADPHALSAGAVIGANGSITYPGTGETQPSLFRTQG